MNKHLLPVILALGLVLAMPSTLRAQNLEIFGLNHVPLGDASLTDISGGGSPALLVSNIGSSGQDGVRVTAGPIGNVFDFLCVEIDEPASPTAPNFVLEAFDVGMPQHPIATGQLREVGAAYQFSALFSGVRGGGQRVSVYDDGELVGETTTEDGESTEFGAWPTFVDPHKQRPLPFPFPDFPVPTDSPVPQDGPWPVAFSVMFAQNTQFFLSGNSFSGDLLVIEPVQEATYQGLRRVEVTATGVDKFIVRGEMVGAFGLPNVALGEASLAPALDRLTLGNLGSGGGVFVGGLPGRAPFEFEFEPFSLDTGDELRLQAFRNPQGPGAPGEVAAELLLRPEEQGQTAREDTTDKLGVWLDYRATQTSDARVEVLPQDGKPKAVVVVPIDPDELTRVFEVAPLNPFGPDGAARSLGGGSSTLSIERLGMFTPPPFPAPFPQPESGFTGRFANGPVTFTFADGTVVEGVGFRVLAEGGQPLGNLSGLSLDISNGFAARGGVQGGLDEIVIVDELLSFPIVGVSAEPMSPPVVIGPGGGSFQWRFRAANASSGPVPVTFRSEVVLPNGNVLPLLGPVTRTLPGGAVVSRTFAQSVPAAAPSGEYVYRVQGRLLDSTLVTDAFVLRKGPSLGSSVVTKDGGDWSIVEVSEAQGNVEAAGRGPSGEAFGLASYPNPASGLTTVAFTLDEQAEVRLAVYNVLGRKVAALIDGEYAPGQHEAVWDASGLSSGVYLVRLETGGTVQTQRLTVVR